ncbi:MAG TPA: tetratricopeptide repeat protein [Acidobacteriota bacterium]
MCLAALQAPSPMLAAQAESSEPSTETFEPLPVPDVSLEQLEAAVATQLHETQRLLDALRSERGSSAAELGEAYGELGRIYHAYRLDAQAEACYLNAIGFAPGDPRWPYYLASLYQSMGRPEQAASYYRRVVEAQPDSLAPRVHLGEMLLDQNRLAEARAQFERALRSDPACPAAQAGLGQVALAEQRYADAVRHFEAALQQVPEANRLHYSLAQAYRGLGNPERARRHLEQRGMVGVRPPDPLIDELTELTRGEVVHLLRGRLAFRAERFAEAAAAFAKAVAARPDSAGARVNLGTALARMEDPAGAMLQYREALKLEPRSTAAHFNLAALLAEQGSEDQAIEHFEAVLAIDPADAEVHQRLARLYRERGRWERALERYRDAARLEPRSEEAALGEAVALVELGRYAEARARLEQAHDQMPDQGRIAHALARMLAAGPDLEQRDGERALQLALAVQRARPAAEHAQTVASALAELGRCEEAAAWLLRARESAEQTGHRGLFPELDRTLERYRRGAPCRDPGGEEG